MVFSRDRQYSRLSAVDFLGIGHVNGHRQMASLLLCTISKFDPQIADNNLAV